MSLLQRDARTADCIAASFPCSVHPIISIHTNSKADAEDIISVVRTVTRYETLSMDHKGACWFEAGPFHVFYPGDEV